MSRQSLTLSLPKRFQGIPAKASTLSLKAFIRRFQNASMVAKQRQRLAQLDDNQLKDIGISRSEALAESSRGFWDIPEHLK